MDKLKAFVNDNCKLYSLPDIYIRLKQVIDDPDSALPDAADVITSDPAITMRILRLVNSAFFGFGQKIETARHAVNMLGLQQLHDLVLATSVTHAFDGLNVKLMDMQKFWHQSILCGVTARILATRCNVLDSERLFVAGLLADIGHLLMYQKLPQEMQVILNDYQLKNTPLVQLEQASFGFDYSQVGQALMREWDLPESLQTIVGYHTCPANTPSYELQVAIVHIAYIMTAREGDISEDFIQQIDVAASQLVALSYETLQDIQQNAIEQVTQAENLLYRTNNAA